MYYKNKKIKLMNNINMNMNNKHHKIYYLKIMKILYQ